MRPQCTSTWPAHLAAGVPDEHVRCDLLDGHTGNHEGRSPAAVYSWARGERPPVEEAAALVELAQAAAELQAAIALASAFAPTNARQLGAFLALQGFRRVAS